MADTTELLSQRRAAALFAAISVPRRHARRVLESGLAGDPVVTPSALLYDRAVVQQLVERPLVRADRVDELCPHGLFVARREINVRSSRDDQVAVLEPGWTFSGFTALWLDLLISRRGPLPFVATIAGFVVFGGVIEALRSDGSHHARLRLGMPGEWFDEMADGQLVTGPGREWSIRGWSASTRPTDSFPHGMSTFPWSRGRYETLGT
jgi:hypothetical protein